MYLNVLRLIVFLTFYSLHSVDSKTEKNSCSSVIWYHIANFSPKCYHNPDVLSNVQKMCQNRGFKFETFSLTTEDGYILNVFKITSNSVNTTKSPVFLQHGLAINSGSWTSTNQRSLAFHLVNQGYEVYLGNTRGSLYSNQHKTLTVNDPSYWQFNLDTLTNDLRLQVMAVADRTNQKMLYIGHSMGTTLSFMFASEYSEDAQNLLRGIVALAPVVYLDGNFATELLTPIALLLIEILNVLQIKGLQYQEDSFHKSYTNMCKTIPEVCYLIFSSIYGPSCQFMPEDLLLFTSYSGSGTSIYELKHYLQIGQSKSFQKYDYGTQQNQQFYNSSRPPTYDLNKVKVPVALMYGEHDIIYDKKNIDRLYNELGSSNKTKYSVPTNADKKYQYTHMDFLYSRNLINYLYNDLDKILESFLD